MDMDYQSTRDSSLRLSSAEAIAQGISAEGGLFVPTSIPSLSLEELKSLLGASYREKAKAVLKKFLNRFYRRRA